MKIVAKNLRKAYGDREVVSDISLEIRPGQILALLGPNGAGKSTIIKMLTGQIVPNSGIIEIEGMTYNQIPKEFRGTIGVMPQEVVVWGAMTTLENIRMAGVFQGLSGKLLDLSVKSLVQSLNLEPELHTQARNLSGGYKRRLNLAVSIVHDPEIVFLDEPSPGIDPQNRRFLWKYIELLREQNKAVVLTDHYLEEAEALADYIIIVDEGKVLAEGTNQELKHRYGNGSILQLHIDPKTSSQSSKDFIDWCQTAFDDADISENEIRFLAKNGGDVLEEVMDSAKKHSVSIQDITLKQPTLEDIFLLLTGHEIRE